MQSTSTASPLTNIGVGQIVPALKIVFEAIFHRGEIVAVELSQVREYVFLVVIAGHLAVGFAILGGFAVTFMVAAMVWDRPDRTMILGLVAVLYLVLAAALGIFTALRIRNDHDCLQTILTAGPEAQSNGHAK